MLDLLLRPLDDLHRIATAAGQIAGRLDALDARADRIEALLADIDGRAAAVLDAAGDAEQQLGQVAGAAGELTRAVDQLVAALPMLERAVALATPLEGTVERIGRIVDRLPAGRGPRRPGG